LGLENGNYTLVDQLYNDHSTELIVEQGTGRSRSTWNLCNHYSENKLIMMKKILGLILISTVLSCNTLGSKDGKLAENEITQK
jgi:hypothetical protein